MNAWRLEVGSYHHKPSPTHPIFTPSTLITWNSFNKLFADIFISYIWATHSQNVGGKGHAWFTNEWYGRRGLMPCSYTPHAIGYFCCHICTVSVIRCSDTTYSTSQQINFPSSLSSPFPEILHYSLFGGKNYRLLSWKEEDGTGKSRVNILEWAWEGKGKAEARYWKQVPGLYTT